MDADSVAILSVRSRRDYEIQKKEGSRREIRVSLHGGHLYQGYLPFLYTLQNHREKVNPLQFQDDLALKSFPIDCPFGALGREASETRRSERE